MSPQQVSVPVTRMAQVWLPPMDAPFGTMAMLGDPQGAPFYLMTPIPPPDQPDAVSDVFLWEAATEEIMQWRHQPRVRTLIQETLGASFLPRLWRSGVEPSRIWSVLRSE